MKKETLISIIIIGGLILLGTGYWLGQNTQEGKGVLVSELFESGLVYGFSANVSGEVKEVSIQTIILAGEQPENIIELSVSEEAKIYRLTPEFQEGGVLKKEEISLEDIQIGDWADISCKISEEGLFKIKEIDVISQE